MALEVIFAIGIAAFLLVTLATRLENEGSQSFLRLLLIGFFFFMLLLLGKAAIDNNDHCIDFVQNQTVSGNTTTFEYGHFCTTNDKNTADTFYIVLVRLFWVFMIYLFIWIIWKFLEWIGKQPKDLIRNINNFAKGQR